MANLYEDTGFISASQARDIAVGGFSASSDVLSEIQAIQTAIMTAAAAGGLSATVSASTTITNSSDYFFAWNDPNNHNTSTDRLYRVRMDKVIAYFTRLGFNIKRTRVGTTNTFQWDITW